MKPYVAAERRNAPQPVLMLAASGNRYVLPRKVLTAFRQGLVPDGLLLRLRAPAGDRHDLPFPAHRLDTGSQQPGGPPLQQDVGVTLVRSCQVRRSIPEGMVLVDDQ